MVNPFRLLICLMLAAFCSIPARAQVISDTSTIHISAGSAKPGQYQPATTAKTSVKPKVFLHLDPAFKDSTTVKLAAKPLTGLTVPNSTLQINDLPIKVYSTGAFGLMLNLKPGLNKITFRILTPDSLKLDTSIQIIYQLPKPAADTKDFKIEEVRIYPSQDQELVTGDVLKLRVKALPGCQVYGYKNTELMELPFSQTSGIRGIYQANYIVRQNDTLPFQKLTFILKSKEGKINTAKSQERIGINDAGFPKVGLTRGKGALPYMNFGLGEDRLGGAKLGYLDTLVRMKLSGKVGDLYRVDLSEHQTAWIPQNLVDIMPQGTFFPTANTGNITVSGDSSYDYVRLTLTDKLPYSSDLLVNPTRITVDVYGATSNTNWIMQHISSSVIRNVNTEQLEDHLFRITIDLLKEQSWGYSVGYEKGQLVIRIKHEPAHLDIKGLTIAVDAGHGGSNYGTQGITGIYEKNFTLLMANQVKAVLEAAGAKVVLTRNADLDLSMYTRVQELKAFRPDILISIHANAVDNPEVSGNSTYYRYAGFRSLSLAIFQKILQLGLNDYGNVGRFNFSLSGPSDYPNALVETAFLSNPSDEARLLDPVFQKQLAEKILEGVNEFLKNAGRKNDLQIPKNSR